MQSSPKLPVQPEKKAMPALSIPEEQVKTEQFVAPKVVEENTQLENSTTPEQNLLNRVQIDKNTLEEELPELSSATPNDMPPPGSGIGIGASGTSHRIKSSAGYAGVCKRRQIYFAYLGNEMQYPKEDRH